MKNRIPLNFSLTEEIDLSKDSFTLEGKDYSVPCVFQIWEKTESLRSKILYRNTTELFKFVKKEHADFRIQRVGGKAGKASIDTNSSVSSNYFFKNTSIYSTEKLIEEINNISFPSVDHTTGPRSLPKGELIQCLESKLGITNNSSIVSNETALF